MLTGVYRTDSQGYKEFCVKLHSIEAEEECKIELAVEATGNARYFKNKMEAEGFSVLVVNTSKFIELDFLFHLYFSTPKK